MTKYLFKTERLGIRNWEESDLSTFAKMGRDEEVMKYFPSLLSLQQSIDLITRMKKQFEENGYGYLPVEVLEDQEFIGMVGMSYQRYDVVTEDDSNSISNFIDIGWRLKTSAWGKGYATEGAKGWINYAFENLNIEIIYCIAPVINIPSQNVMNKIGFIKIDEFNHPKISIDHPTRRCSLYKKSKV